MRTFLAIPLPAGAQAFLGEVQTKLRNFGADVRWAAVPSIHLTLKFLGEIDPVSLPPLVKLVRERTGSQRSFSLRLHGIGAFPNLHDPRVIWCGLEGEISRLQSLQADVEMACQAAGFAGEDRPFHPHLTLGRVRGKTNLRALADYIKIGATSEYAVVVAEFNVYQSILRPQGAQYTVLEKIELRGE